MGGLTIRPGMPLDTSVLEELNRGRIIQKLTFTNSSSLSVGTSWVQGMITPEISKSEDTDIILDWRFPSRNDDSNWGGMYIDIQYSEDHGNTWTSVGNSGYDGGCMIYGGDGIGSMSGHHVFKNLSTDNFMVRFLHRTYNGTGTVNDGRGQSGIFYTTMYIKEVTR